MRFSKGPSFNTHDAKVEKGDDGRIKIDMTRGVKARCELSLNALIRFWKGANAEMISDHLNSRLKSNYTTTDIRYALTRLVKEGVIKSLAGGRGEETIYRATKLSLDHWRRLNKFVI